MRAKDTGSQTVFQVLFLRAFGLLYKASIVGLVFVLARMAVRLYYGTPLSWLNFAGISYTQFAILFSLVIASWHFKDDILIFSGNNKSVQVLDAKNQESRYEYWSKS